MNARSAVRLRVLAGNTALVLVGLSASAAALHTLPPVPTEMTYEDRRIERARPWCEVLFIGPSYVKAQIIEPVFDQEAKRLGVPMRSCKFGGTGVRGIELQLHLTRLLRRSWPKLRFVVIDITLREGLAFERENWFKARYIQWHTWESMPWILRSYQRRPSQASLTNYAGHAAHLAANYSNLGTGIELFSRLHVVTRLRALVGAKVRVPRADVERQYTSELRSWERRKKAQAHTNLSPAAWKRHRQKLASLIRGKRAARKHAGNRDDAWPRELRAWVEQRGFEPVFLNAPVWRPVREMKPRTRPLVVLDFNDPERFPVLYEPKNRGRTHHLSWYGGVEYSKLLAHDMAKLWTGKRQ